MLFVGKLVNLRAVKEEDLELAAQYLSDPELLLLLDDDAPVPTSKDRQKEWYADYLKKKDTYERIDELAIETKEGKYIGTCEAFHISKKNRTAEVGIFIAKEYQGKGYGTEAMQLLLKFIFEELNINRVELHVFSFNGRALKSYEKCGFKLEAVNREAIFRYGKYHDLCVMSILREEYLEKYKEEKVGN